MQTSNFFMRLFSHTGKSAVKENETIHSEEKKDPWTAQTSPFIKELLAKVKDCDYEGVFEMLENGVDPNLPMYPSLPEDCKNDSSSRYSWHIMDYFINHDDKAMIKLLRAYGAKSSEEILNEERRKTDEEIKREEQRRELFVDSLLKKRQLMVGG